MALVSGQIIEVKIIGNSTSAVAATNEQTAAQDRLAASAKKASASAQTMSKSMYTAGAKMATVGQSISRYVSLPLAAIGVASVAAAASFQKNMVLLRTEAGASQKEVKKLHDFVLKLAEVSKFGPTELSKGLYHIESAGIRGAKAMKALHSATKLASIGNAELELTARAVSNAYESGIQGAHNFNHAAGVLNATVGVGNMRMNELVAALGTGMLTTARQARISFGELGAAVATLTSQGINAQVAGTRLRMGLHLLVAPSEKARSALGEIGIKGDELAEKIGKEGLGAGLKFLQEHLDKLGSKYKQTDILSAAFGGARTGTTIEALLQSANKFDNKLGEIHEHADQVNKDFRETTKTTAFELSNAWSKIQVAAVKLGEALIPTLIPMLKSVAKFVTGVADKFSSLSEGVRKWAVIIGIALVAAGPMIIFFSRLIQGMGVLIGLFTDFKGTLGLATASTEAMTAATSALSAEEIAAADATSALNLQLARRAELEKLGWAGTVGANKLGLAGGPVTGISKYTSRLGKAATYGAGIAIGGQVAGGLIGGKAGGVVSSAGNLAGAGAAIGTMINPGLGTAIGAGVGAGAGGLLALLGTSKIPAMESRIKDSIKSVTDGFKESREAAQNYAAATDALKESQQKGKHITNELSDAEHHLKKVKEDDKASTEELHEAELKVYNLRAKSKQNADEQQKLDDRKRAAQKANVHLAVDEVNNIVLTIHAETQRFNHLKKRIAQEGETHELSEKMRNTTSRLLNLEGKRDVLFQQIGKSSKKMREEVEGLNEAQRKYGKEGGSILRVMEQQKTELHNLSVEGVPKTSAAYQELQTELQKTEHRMSVFMDKTSPKIALWASTGSTKIAGLKGAFENMGEGTRRALEALGFNVDEAAKELGIASKAPHFNMKVAKEFHLKGPKQRGGHIYEGAPSGDSVPAMLEKDEYVLNRKAVRHLGKNFLDSVNFGVAPRFQHGGSTNLQEPKLSGPGTLRAIGQAAIHDAFGFAREFLKKLKPQFGMPGGPLGSGSSATERQLEKLWVSVGGPKGIAHLMAAIGMAESGGNPRAHNASGASGLWQIMMPLHQGIVHGSVYDPTVNAKAALSILHSQGLGAWETYTNGAYRQYMAEGGYVTPFKHSTNLAWGRIDEGVDFTGSGPISAIGAGTITSISPNWYKNQPIVNYKLADGPKAGSYVYIAEGISGYPGVGSHFNAGDTIARFAHGTVNDSIETGWGSGPPGMPAASGHYNDGEVTTEGRSFYSFLKGLPAKGGGGKASASETATPSAPSFISGKMPTGHVESIAGGVGPTVAYTGNYKVQTSPLSFGTSFPKSIEGCKKELRERRRDLAEYKAAIHDNPKYRSALEKNVNLIRGRIQALIAEIKRLLIKKRRERILAKIAKSGNFEDLELGLEKLENEYTERSERAEEIIGLEPEEETAALFSYINSQEIPAYQSILEVENRWRNAVIRAEGTVSNREFDLNFQIDHIEGLKKSNPEAYKKEKYKLKDLRAALAAAENLYVKKTYGQKTKVQLEKGELVSKLAELQGMGGNKDIRDMLPWAPSVGAFGTGVIWDTQNTIKELTLKKPGTAGQEEAAAEKLALQESINAELRRELALHGQSEVIKHFLETRLPFVGAFATGGTVPLPMGQAGMALVHGQETIVPAGANGPVNIYLHGDLRHAVRAYTDGLVKTADETIGRDARRIAFSPGRS